VLALSILGEFVFYILSLQFTEKYYAPIMAVFGWMFWLGILSFLIPLFVSRDKAFEWFQEKYVWASFILFIIHIVCLIVVGELTVSMYYDY
jgi:hypothetical protein